MDRRVRTLKTHAAAEEQKLVTAGPYGLRTEAAGGEADERGGKRICSRTWT